MRNYLPQSKHLLVPHRCRGNRFANSFLNPIYAKRRRAACQIANSDVKHAAGLWCDAECDGQSQGMRRRGRTALLLVEQNCYAPNTNLGIITLQ